MFCENMKKSLTPDEKEPDTHKANGFTVINGEARCEDDK